MRKISRLTGSFFTFACLSAPLTACVGGTLSDTTSVEMLPLRAATDDEGKDLKHCLKTAHAAQEQHRRETGKFARKLKELPLRSACKDLLMSQGRTQNGYEIRAEIREDEHAVRWSVNEKGVIEEHLDPEDSEPDLEF